MAAQRVLEGIASREGGYRVPHTMVRHGHGGLRGAPRRVGETLEGGGAPGISRLVQPDAGMTGARVPLVCHTVSHHSSSGQRPAAQLVSTKALGEVHRRMTTCIGAPQVGQRAASGCGGLRCSAGHRWGVPAHSSGGWSRAGMAQLAWRKPKWRTFMKP